MKRRREKLSDLLGSAGNTPRAALHVAHEWSGVCVVLLFVHFSSSSDLPVFLFFSSLFLSPVSLILVDFWGVPICCFVVLRLDSSAVSASQAVDAEGLLLLVLFCLLLVTDNETSRQQVKTKTVRLGNLERREMSRCREWRPLMTRNQLRRIVSLRVDEIVLSDGRVD